MPDITLVAVRTYSGTRQPLRIVLIVGSGCVGTLLARHFHQQRNQVTVVERGTFAVPWRIVKWDGVRLGDWAKAFEGANVVINLAGRSADCRYNSKNRIETLESRIRPPEIVGQAIGGLFEPPALWLNAGF